MLMASQRSPKAVPAFEIRNPKLEIRNKSEIRNSKARNLFVVGFLGVATLRFEFVSELLVARQGFRISDLRLILNSPSSLGRDCLDGGSLDIHVHLLPHEQWQRTIVHTINNLQHPRVHTLRAVTSERLLREHEWLEAHKANRRSKVGVTAH